LEAAQHAQEVLDGGSTLFAAHVDPAPLRELSLLTTKPFLYVFNADEAVLTDVARRKELDELVAPADAVFLDAKVESELLELDEASSRELLESIGQDEPGLAALARAGFHTLGLQTYLTAGPKESRAWTIRAGATAPQAAGVIHTDFERGFIRAEVIAYEEYIRGRGESGAREAGKLRLEGKEYVVREGDVMHFRFNV
jgi:ribosome-binding ATPase YchF (GTP1/OBG family)